MDALLQEAHFVWFTLSSSTLSSYMISKPIIVHSWLQSSLTNLWNRMIGIRAHGFL